MISTRSLSFRVILFLVAGQLAAFLFGWLLMTGLGLIHYEDYDLSLDDLAYTRTRFLALESLTRDPEGRLALVPRTALQSEMSGNPDLQIAIYDIENWSAIPGSSPELVSALAPVSELNPGYFSFASRNASGAVLQGVLQTVGTPYGRVRMAFRGHKFLWTDILRAATFDVRWLAGYVAPAMFVSIVVAWIVIRRGLAPLRAIAREAAGIDLNSLNQRLSGAKAPTEILPLVEAMNDALTRLDADAARLRRFTANAAHELRTPVAILIARLDAPKTESLIVDLQRDAFRIRNVVEQLLAAARAPDAPDPNQRPEDLVAIARAVVSDATLLAIQHGRQIELCAPDAPVLARATRAAIESVLSNLLDNALRAEPARGVVIVAVRDDASIAVVDHGPGVAEADRELVFEPFWRKSDAHSGVGLGLAITKELMTRCGGRIFVEESPGGGATFVIAFRAPGATE